MPSAAIDTEGVAARMRQRILRAETREILISRLGGSAQEVDLTSPVNCGGLGRIRHFRRNTSPGWPENILPIGPAARALGLIAEPVMEAQVFQNAGCAWRCWYCYVPFELLGGDERRAEWVTAEELVARYAALPQRPSILDLSGGSPDLTPEWIPWTMAALKAAGLADTTYLWSDDNLSTDLVFEVLTASQRRMLASPNYGRVCCFKGFDEESFAFNTGARPEEFGLQFDRFARYLDLNIDLYAYVTFTGPSAKDLEEKIVSFHERLSAVWSKLPSRTVPLKVEVYGTVARRRHRRDMGQALAVQDQAVAVWNDLIGASGIAQ